MFEFEENLNSNAKIKIIGVGGGGGNALKTMIRAQLDNIDFVAVNTDIQALKQNEAAIRIQIGKKLTRGLGAGANPEVGRGAALEDATMISESLSGCDMVFITAGMGGGTGTGAAPVIANVAREMGILTVGIVTKPFSFEGRKRMRHAEEGIEALRREVDTLICIPNDKLLALAGKDTPMIDSFKMADHVLLQAVRSISDLITIPGLINLDFADVKTIMSNAGIALMGTGMAGGENRAIEAAKMAISSPLLENISIAGATGILLNITGPSSMTLFEVNEASKLVQQEAHEEANIIFGSVVDDDMKDELRVTVIATGFDKIIPRDERTADRATAFFPKSWLKYKNEPAADARSADVSASRRQSMPQIEEEIPAQLPASASSSRSFVLAQSSRDDSIHSVFAQSRTEKPLSERPTAVGTGQNLSLLDDFDDLPLAGETPPERTPASEPFRTRSAPAPETRPAPQWGASQSPAARSSRLFGKGGASSAPRTPFSSGTAALGEALESQIPVTRGTARRDQELSEMKKMMSELKTSGDDDEYELPAFIRRRAD